MSRQGNSIARPEMSVCRLSDGARSETRSYAGVEIQHAGAHALTMVTPAGTLAASDQGKEAAVEIERRAAKDEKKKLLNECNMRGWTE